MKRVYGIETEFGYEGSRGFEFPSRFLRNGGRLYVDVGKHPEYCTPECTGLRQLVAYDKAGELITLQTFGGQVRKNNIDSSGTTYGSHENYLIKSVPISEIAPYLIPFLVTRQIFAGAGGLTPNGKFVLSPRALKIRQEIGMGSTAERPIVHIRDEPHADKTKYARLHLILGEANMSEVQTYIKVGTTSLILDLIDMGKCPKPDISNPVDALHKISTDTDEGWVKPKANWFKHMRATDLQRVYLDAAYNHCERTHETQEILRGWQGALDALDKDHESLSTWADWAIKRRAMEAFMKEHNLSPDHDRIFNINLDYHNVDRERGLFYAIQRKGWVERLVTDEEIQAAVETPPRDTRAWFRGNLIRLCETGKIVNSSMNANWAAVDFTGMSNDFRRYEIPDPLDSYDRYLDELVR
jgi:proteasome accessory factor A